MARYAIKSRDSLIWHIIRIWKKDPGLGLMYNEWLEFAMALEIPFNTIQQLKQNILFGQKPFTEILYHIINAWQGSHGPKIATVQTLVKTLKEIDLWSYAESLEEAFRLSETEETKNRDEESDVEANISHHQSPSDLLNPSTNNLTRGITHQSLLYSKQNEDEINLSDILRRDSHVMIVTCSAKSQRFSRRRRAIGGKQLCHCFSNLLDLFRSIVDISPFRSLSDASDQLNFSTRRKQNSIQKIRKVLFTIVCWITVIISLIDLLWEGYHFDKHVKGTNKVDCYIAFFRKLGTAALRFAFLYLGFSKVGKFAENLEKQYPNDRYKDIFTKKLNWISEVSVLFVICLTSAVMWMPKDYLQDYSEMQKITFFDKVADFSKHYRRGFMIFVAVFRFFLMIVEQYALDLILVVTITLKLGLNELMNDVKKHFEKILIGKDKQVEQISKQQQESEENAGLEWLCCGANVLRRITKKSKTNLVEIPLQNTNSIHSALAILNESEAKLSKPSSSKPIRDDHTTKLLQLRYDYRELRTIFRSTNKLIGIIYIISLFIGLLLVSSLEDTLLNSKVNIIDKLEYSFIFGKMCAIVYIGCKISFTLEKLHGEEYTNFFSTLDIPHKERRDRSRKQQKDNQIPTTSKCQSVERKQSLASEDIVAEDLCSLLQPVQRNPIGLGNHPFTMNVKFLAHHLGLALFTIFLGIVSTRSDKANPDFPSGVNNSLLINGSYIYE